MAEELKNNDKVKLIDNDNNIIYTVSQIDYEREICWIEYHGTGWYAYFHQIEKI